MRQPKRKRSMPSLTAHIACRASLGVWICPHRSCLRIPTWRGAPPDFRRRRRKTPLPSPFLSFPPPLSPFSCPPSSSSLLPSPSSFCPRCGGQVGALLTTPWLLVESLTVCCIKLYVLAAVFVFWARRKPKGLKPKGPRGLALLRLYLYWADPAHPHPPPRASRASRTTRMRHAGCGPFPGAPCACAAPRPEGHCPPGGPSWCCTPDPPDPGPRGSPLATRSRAPNGAQWDQHRAG